MSSHKQHNKKSGVSGLERTHSIISVNLEPLISVVACVRLLQSQGMLVEVVNQDLNSAVTLLHPLSGSFSPCHCLLAKNYPWHVRYTLWLKHFNILSSEMVIFMCRSFETSLWDNLLSLLLQTWKGLRLWRWWTYLYSLCLCLNAESWSCRLFHIYASPYEPYCLSLGSDSEQRGAEYALDHCPDAASWHIFSN